MPVLAPAASRRRTPVVPRQRGVRMTTEPSTGPEGPAAPGGMRGFAHRAWRESQEIELMHRALGFAALGLVTLIPLLLVVSAAAPVGGRAFPSWLAAALGLSSKAAQDLGPVFGSPVRTLSTTTALSLAGLAAFGLSFVSTVQVGFERIWTLPAGQADERVAPGGVARGPGRLPVRGGGHRPAAARLVAAHHAADALRDGRLHRLLLVDRQISCSPAG